MYELVRTSSIHQLLARQMPSMVASLAIAELFYKFHSFTLEALAFLATWYALGSVVSVVTRLWAAMRGYKPM